MSDTRVTRSARRSASTATDRAPQIRVCGGTGTYHTNPAQILALCGSQRAPYGPLPTSTPTTTPRTAARRKALTERLSAPVGTERSTAAMAGREGRPPSLTIPEVIAELKVSRSTFYYWRQTGKAPRCIKLPNGEIRVRRVDLDEWFDSLEEAA
ncbi:hypothetical protein Pme01_60980 [Planosporangium mesophilum]|uniref:Helix-turn-helix domain-containing protein n=2 Tax=Planosporangium mesophilum TaxID=689768 RepID=A0A8J3TIZ1_9ACTN|nr:hypothetical protein Pme01_60980 [Planosporangium mesophilum]